MSPNQQAGIFREWMNLFPRHRQIIFLLMPDGLSVRRQSHERGPSLIVAWFLTLIDFQQRGGRKRKQRVIYAKEQQPTMNGKEPHCE